MTNEELNELFNRLLVGLPVTLVVLRLGLAMRVVIDAGGEPAAQAFRQYVEDKTGEGTPDQEDDS